MRCAALIVVGLITAIPVQARTLVLCTSPGRRDVTISLQDRTFKGRQLNCISGDFVADMTPCAPTGGLTTYRFEVDPLTVRAMV